MVAKKRLSKRAIKEDPLVTLALRTSGFVQAHFTQVITGVVVLVAAIGIVLFTANARRGAVGESERQLAIAMDQFLLRSFESASTAFQLIADRYSKHTAGQTSMYFLGECYLSLYRYQEAVDAYDRYLDSVGSVATFSVAATIGKAYAYEGLVQFQPAAEVLTALADTMNPDDARYTDVLFGAGSFWEEADDIPRAIGFYTRVAEVATGTLKSRADVKLALLE